MPPPDPAIRSVGPAAAAALSHLHAAAFAPLGQAPWPDSAFRELLGQDATAALVAEDDTGIRAFILARAAAGEAEILTLATDPARQRRGLARRLLASLLSRYAALGIRHIYLEVMAENSAAIALYHRAGFHKVGERPDYYQDTRTGHLRPALILAKNLEYLGAGAPPS